VNTTTFVHCTGNDVEIDARASSEDIVLQFSQGSDFTVFMTEDQANRTILKLARAISEMHERAERHAENQALQFEEPVSVGECPGGPECTCLRGHHVPVEGGAL
jgi:hypothetical protein